MKYRTTTVPRLAQVAAGWMLVWSGGLLLFTFPAFAGEGFPVAPTVAAVLAAGSALALTLLARHLRALRRENIHFFTLTSGSAVLRQRRETERRLTRARWLLLLAMLAAGAIWVVSVSGVKCTAPDSCVDTWAGAGVISDVSWVVTLVLGTVLVANAALVRVYATETEELEVVAANSDTHRGDGLAGLGGSRWE